ncbi:MAG: hypothetical protein A3C43_05585 [Candidatus Schekmanbacteria bacterium RIFCSPHIGHO2_02_FULL_38_11]|uniref:Quinohemoprotein amine dehydrogenase alpha subunit domain-containing protein n=1 Tax=Candidatus Schekmanbacteria bacterium RIFCSPLOWO2_12_FULL_38_15 TaxID=1817883 RepID=A0A1F7SNQ2_9BACT|nr:MAG: hypothetical protein A2043_01260 [Candidatus Schekmanbacteria bacterium GWA2_38_9]OGL51013.1 MAG: hypothetical protein A3H37_11090 [Candidatus Schekmanbacteria bacterium RIFCSPLOWO2_02_FULL_38_14]OGL53861.1 MAG: hypothetical protein A3C43_05585 [Candidatus Schekmanbacteria bacterium RIFCSPHIGHO2_02_FULL_38_11]OGL54858.1 MAG: hypothetical protein A3G31_01920 [Candidatus Schekmanbacteria bacterium RIFCSPLOWO2_12_FULL_38_15]
MRKFRFLILFIMIGVFIIPISAFAAISKIKVTAIVPKLIKQNDTKTITIKGSGFKQNAEVNLGQGITVLSTTVKSREIKVQVEVALDAKIGYRTIIVENTNGKKAKKLKGLKVQKCINDCEEPVPFTGNPIPIHDKNSSQYRTDCTNASCHKGILKETSLNSSIDTFHVLKILKLSIIPGKTNDAKCLYCHKNTDIVERSAGSLRKNVDVAICYPCHAPGSIGKEFYKE